MANDDETIGVTANAQQALAQFNALGIEVEELEKELRELNATAGVTNAEINGTTRRLTEAREKFEKAGTQVQSFGQQTRTAGLDVKDLTKSIGAGLSVISILQENLRALQPILERNKELFIEHATAAGADKETLEGLALAFDSLTHPSHILANALKATAAGMKLIAEEAVGTSKVVANVTDSIPQMLAKIAEARKASATENVETKTEEGAAADKLAAQEEALEAAAVKSAEARAAAEEAAGARVIAALEEQRVARLKAHDEIIKQAQERLNESLAKDGSGTDEIDTSGARTELEGLKQQIRALNDSPVTTEEQQSQLDGLRKRVREVSREIEDAGEVFSRWNTDSQLGAERASNAWKLYYAIRHKNDQLVQDNQDEDIRRLGETGEALDDVSESAEDVQSGYEGISEAAKDIGESGKKGADKAAEGLEALVDTQKIVIENNVTILRQGEEIKRLFSEITLE